jgi:predicted site-specific integrase-resolvase
MTETTTSDLASADEIGAMIGKPGKTILEWFKRGIIPAEIAIGAYYRFDPASVREALRIHAAEKQAKIASKKPSSIYQP